MLSTPCLLHIDAVHEIRPQYSKSETVPGGFWPLCSMRSQINLTMSLWHARFWIKLIIDKYFPCPPKTKGESFHLTDKFTKKYHIAMLDRYHAWINQHDPFSPIHKSVCLFCLQKFPWVSSDVQEIFGGAANNAVSKFHLGKCSSGIDVFTCVPAHEIFDRYADPTIVLIGKCNCDGAHELLDFVLAHIGKCSHGMV